MIGKGGRRGSGREGSAYPTGGGRGIRTHTTQHAHSSAAMSARDLAGAREERGRRANPTADSSISQRREEEGERRAVERERERDGVRERERGLQ